MLTTKDAAAELHFAHASMITCKEIKCDPVKLAKPQKEHGWMRSNLNLVPEGFERIDSMDPQWWSGNAD